MTVVEQIERDDGVTRRSVASVVALPVLLIDLGLSEIFEDIALALYNGAFGIIELLFAETIGNLLKIPPSRLTLMQDMWSLSVAVYFALLSILGLSYLGMFQLFPASKKTDPYRFMGRAFAATLSLFIINPPGGMSTLFSRGAFAWALEITNILVDYFLLNMTYTPNNYAGATSGLIAGGTLGYFGAMSFGMLMLLVVGILLVVLYVVLAARMLVILITFGLYPLLIVFWVADVGPMKYGKQLSGKLFKATGMLIPLGILLAAVLSTAGQMMTGALVNLGGNNPLVTAVMVTIPIPVAAFMMITMTMAPLKMAGVGLGAAVGQAQGAVSKAGCKGKSMVRGGAAGGGSRLGGLAGGAALGGALANEDDEPVMAPDRGGIVSSTAPELDSPSAVSGQSSLGQQDDGGSTGLAAHDGQEYTDAEQSGGTPASSGQEGATPEYTPGDLTEAQAMVMADGNEGVARKVLAMDEYLADQQDSTLVGTLKEASKGMLGGASGFAAGALVAGSGPIGFAAAAGAGLAAGAAGYGVTQGIDRAKPVIKDIKVSVPSISGSSYSSSGDLGGNNSDSGYR